MKKSPLSATMFTCTKGGFVLMEKLKAAWQQEEPRIQIKTIVKTCRLPEQSEEKSLTECVGESFCTADALVFFTAAGIAVRSIAPWIGHKAVDPAVVVVDETGKFSISLLSGHSGGANEIAELIGRLLGACPVITTATDREGRFSPDDFARKNQLTVTDWNQAKKLSAAILDGKQIGIVSGLPAAAPLPKELYWYEEGKRGEKGEFGIVISYERRKEKEEEPFGSTLWLVPKRVAAGIGCRKGTKKEEIQRAVEECLKKANICPEAVSVVASINLKKEEQGIAAYCEEKQIPFLTFSPEELKAVKGEFSVSPFVQEVTGVSNVCERSAVAAVREGKLLCRKSVYFQVTVALAVREERLIF